MDAAAVVAEEVQQHQFVVAEHGMEPRLLDERQRAERVGAAVDQIADGQHAIPARIEADALELLLEQRAVSMQVADDQVASMCIGLQREAARDPGELHDLVPVARRVQGKRHAAVPRR